MTFYVIATWVVRVHLNPTTDVVFRVPETNLDQFLHVLTFNKREFTVELERLPEQVAA